LITGAFPFSINDLLDFLTFVFVGFCSVFFGRGAYKNGYSPYYTEGYEAILGSAQVGSLTEKWHFILIGRLHLTARNPRLLTLSGDLGL